jgi:oligopeptide/dipeptide ABC transporter ATP-binding protein
LIRIQDELNLSYVFISHDLSMVRHVSDEIAVIYLGRIVESGHWANVLDEPLHPYTKALADAVPVPDPERERARSRRADPAAASPAAPPGVGCPYAPRCPLREAICTTVDPPLAPVPDGRLVACHVVARRLAVTSAS